MGRFFVAYPGQQGVTWLTDTGKDVVNPRSVRVNRVKYNGGVWWTLHLYSEREGTWLTSRSKSKIHWDNRRTLPPLPLTQWRKQRHPCVMPLSQASLAASLMCVCLWFVGFVHLIDGLQQQLAAYVSWVNSQLKRKPGLKLIADLRHDLQDGVVLTQLIEIVGKYNSAHWHTNKWMTWWKNNRGKKQNKPSIRCCLI